MTANLLKSRIKKFVQIPFGQWDSTQRARETEELDHIISRVWDLVDVSGINNPDHHSSLAFDLFRKRPSVVEFVKDDGADDEALKRFRKMLGEIRAGHSPITVRDAVQILEMSNELIGSTEDHPQSGADVGWHFRVSSSFAAKGRLLYNAVRFFRPESILEIGTAYGMSTAFMLLALERYGQKGRLWTIEPEEPQYSIAKQVLTKRFKDSVDCLYGWSHEHIPRLCDANKTFDLIFHDNGHSGEAYIKDFERFSPNMRNGAIVIYDDIRWFDRSLVSEDPQCHRGWKAVVDDPRIRIAVEIDRNLGVALANV
jgi:predicted O-methyltransferase YrrM